MSYSDQSTGGFSAPLPPRSIKPASTPPPPAAVPSGLTVADVATAMLGPEGARQASYYVANLQNAMQLLAELMEAKVDPALGGWLAHEEEIRSASTSLLNAADAVNAMLNSGFSSGKPSPLLNPSLLKPMGPHLLGRILAAGLQCEAEDLLDLIETVPAPAVEPWHVVTDVENNQGAMEPDTAVITLRNGRVLHVCDEGLHDYPSMAAFEEAQKTGVPPASSLSWA